MFNNPLSFIDPTGMAPETIIENTDTGESTLINDGHNFTLEVSDEQYNAVIAAAEEHGADKAFTAFGTDVSWDTYGSWAIGARVRKGAEGLAQVPEKYLELYGPLIEEGVKLGVAYVVLRGMGPLGKGSGAALKGFDDLALNPKAIWGKSADEVGEILGKGWQREKLNSGEGWKYLQKDGDGFVSFTTGNSQHPGSTYYKINSGKYGKQKVVNSSYKGKSNEKSKIHYINE